ncbi:hypothetical protein PoB_006031000 [Plakobranchus ocellatus]|uniref:Uncharacterized protein n=1 Tax=Plakobranchus ocellatus TaxID=259542 RepID=A0AAV4CPL4_9GAST|nr:hypothetical protein PoB_006031000 [Plakobranchus ocellatus]
MAFETEDDLISELRNWLIILTLISFKLRLLQRILSSTRLPLRLLQAVVGWKSELFGGSAQERPLSAQGGSAGSPHRDRQRGVQFSSQVGMLGEHPPGEDEVRGQALRHAHLRSQAGDSVGINVFGKGGRSKRLNPGLGSDSFLVGQGPVETGSSPEHVRFHDKGHATTQHRRSANARSMLRSRSVDLNFNSSSTDGSVFDYDKAVLGLREGQGASSTLFSELGESMGQRHPALSRKQQDKDLAGPPQSRDRLNYGLYTGEEQTPIDPLHLFQGDSRGRLSFALSDGREDFLDGPGKSYAHGPTTRNQAARYVSTIKPHDPESAFSTGQRVRSRPANAPQSSDSSSYERFIRLNLSPRKTSQTSREEFAYPSNIEQVGPMALQGGGREEEESGFDTAEGDPYDSIVTKIREISSSNYTSAEKLQKVSDLISKSRSSGEKQQDIQNRLKTTKSTMDLSRVEQINKRQEATEEGELQNSVGQSDPKERPLEVIQRMKQNLAKSMDDLSSVPMLYESRGADRFRSELRIQPVFSQPNRNAAATIVRSPGFKQSLSDVETSKSSPLLTSPADGGSRTRTASDVDTSLRHPYADDEWSHVADGDGEGSSSSKAPRPSSLAFSSGRNFISPSFLRPAVSMQDLSSRPLTAANLGLLQKLETETDYQALRDMEMLQALQEEPVLQMQQYQENAGGQNTTKGAEFSRDSQSSSSKDKEAASSEQQIQEQSQPSKDVIANFVLYGGVSNLVYQNIVADSGMTPPYASSSSNTSPSWLSRDSPGHLMKQGSTSTEEGEVNSDLLHSQNKEHLNRLSREADQEGLSQENVAQRLKNTQRILEDEEKRQRWRREFVSSVSFEDAGSDEVPEAVVAHLASTSVSLDNGYSSWASRLMSALSTSSEGGEVSGGAVGAQPWRQDNDLKNMLASEDKFSNSSRET